MCKRDDIYYKKINISRGKRKEMMTSFETASIEIFSAIEVFKFGLSKDN